MLILNTKQTWLLRQLQQQLKHHKVKYTYHCYGIKKQIKRRIYEYIHIGYKAFTGKQKKNIHTDIDGSDWISRWQNSIQSTVMKYLP